jgi:uncharacterized protein YbgA (DUF1722 family)
VLKKGSPSCGLERVRVWDESAERLTPSGRGLFAQALVDAVPELAIEEEGRLTDPALREHFVDRIFAHARARDFFAAPWTSESLIRFHATEKAALMAHDAEAARRLGRLVAGQRRREPERLARSYRTLHAAAHARPATPGRQANALMHLAGHLKGELGSCDREELREAIDDYRIGLLPIAVPLALLSRHLRAVGTDWARSQTYLRPYPKQLGLRGVISKPRRRRSAAPSAKPKSPSPAEKRPNMTPAQPQHTTYQDARARHGARPQRLLRWDPGASLTTLSAFLAFLLSVIL